MMEHGRDASQKAELRERIIMTATEAFTLKGIKCITMDDIAAALGISKRTLYEVFADKESLLKEVFCINRLKETNTYRQYTNNLIMCWRLYLLFFRRVLRSFTRQINAFLRISRNIRRCMQ